MSHNAIAEIIKTSEAIMYSIYKIKNNINDKVYIGSTKEFEKRKSRHINELKKNCHHSIYFQRFYNKHIEEIELIFEVLLDNLSVQDVRIKEEELIMQYYDNSFNVSKQFSGGDLLSYHPNKEDIIKRRSATLKDNYSKGLVNTPNTNGSNNPNFKKGEFVKVVSTCPSCNVQKETLNKYKDHLCNSCFASTRTNEKNSFYGKSFSLESKKKLSESIKETNKRQRELGILPKDSKQVYAYGILYLTMNDAAKALSVERKTITARVNSKNWKYRSFYLKGSPKRVEDLKISKTDYSCIVSGINYETVSKAVEKLNISLSTFIYRCESQNQEFNNYEFKCQTTIENIYQI